MVAGLIRTNVRIELYSCSQNFTFTVFEERELTFVF